MPTLRKGHCYSKLTRAYTRKSKFKKTSFIRTIPPSKVVRFDLGDLKRKFDSKVELISKEAIQIRHNAIESARLIINRNLHEKVGANNYHLQIKIYPHHILRENKMLSGAHADRLQRGMQKSFGKPIGLAAQVRQGKTLFTAYVDKANIELARESLKKATPRLPGKCYIEFSEAS